MLVSQRLRPRKRMEEKPAHTSLPHVSTYHHLLQFYLIFYYSLHFLFTNASHAQHGPADVTENVWFLKSQIPRYPHLASSITPSHLCMLHGSQNHFYTGDIFNSTPTHLLHDDLSPSALFPEATPSPFFSCIDCHSQPGTELRSEPSFHGLLAKLSPSNTYLNQ